MQPLVSILIPAYNSEHWIRESLQSAMDQTWPNKEIIVVNDGSRDSTADIVREMASPQVKLITTWNRGQSAAMNTAFRECQGEYIQQLDADDLLSPNKIAAQMAVRDGRLLSCPWAYFAYRKQAAKFLPSSLWADLSPVEWLTRKMGENLQMPNATWLMSRELAEAAGPWDETLRYDQDGEYYTRVLMHSSGVRFVPEAKFYYRSAAMNRMSNVNSKEKLQSLLFSLDLHSRYLLSLEDSERTRAACVSYFQAWYSNFYPDHTCGAQALAWRLGAELETPQLGPKFDWLRIFGWDVALKAQVHSSYLRNSSRIALDRFRYSLERLYQEIMTSRQSAIYERTQARRYARWDH